MGRARKRKTSKRDKYASFSESADEAEEDADLPKDEAAGARSSANTPSFWGSGSKSCADES